MRTSEMIYHYCEGTLEPSIGGKYLSYSSNVLGVYQINTHLEILYQDLI